MGKPTGSFRRTSESLNLWLSPGTNPQLYIYYTTSSREAKCFLLIQLSRSMVFRCKPEDEIGLTDWVVATAPAEVGGGQKTIARGESVEMDVGLQTLALPRLRAR